MFSWLPLNQSSQSTQSNSFVTPYAITDIIIPKLHASINEDILPKRENILGKSGAAKRDVIRRTDEETDNIIAGSSVRNSDQYPPRHGPTAGITAMMIHQATTNLEHWGINLKSYKNFILKK